MKTISQETEDTFKHNGLIISRISSNNRLDAKWYLIMFVSKIVTLKYVSSEETKQSSLNF